MARAFAAGALALVAAAAGACTPSPATVGFSGLGNRGGTPTGGGTGGGGSGGGSAAGTGGGSGITVLPAAPSTGCGTATSQALGQYVEMHITVAGVAANATDRLYYVRLPAGYDPSKAYRTIYLGPGCGEPQDSQPSIIKVYPMEQAAGDQAILIAMEPGLYNAAHYNSASCGTTMTCQYCFDDGADGKADSVEYPYFDALHKTIEAAYCVDTNRQFYAGYSSGGWMAHELGCQFPDVLRVQGNVSGGLPPAIANGTKTCMNHPIAAFLIHDYNDLSNPYSGSVAALNRLLVLNNCAGGQTMDTAPTAPYMIAGVPNTASFSCLQYTGCPANYPIVFCTSQDQAHGSQAPSAVPGFWGFMDMF
jgi:poly(3-hydroxybutyrate) depolymerase